MTSSKTFMNKYFEFTTWFHGIQFKYTPCAYYDNRQLSVSFGWGILFINLWDSWQSHDVNDTLDYWFYYHASSIWLCLWRKTKSIEMPWYYKWVRTSHYADDGKENFTEKIGGSGSCYKIPERKFFYTYITNDWVIQNTVATVLIVEREWRMKWLMWTKRFSKKRRVIDVSFDDPIGEGVWSWKGWTLGCSYQMKPWESALDTLRRMEQERRFN